MTDTQVPLSNVTLIKKFLEADGGRKVEMSEMKALTPEDRQELGLLAGEALKKMGS